MEIQRHWTTEQQVAGLSPGVNDFLLLWTRGQHTTEEEEDKEDEDEEEEEVNGWVWSCRCHNLSCLL